jgi:transposase
MMPEMKQEYEDTLKPIKDIEQQLRTFAENCESSKILLSIPSIGIINASALLASIDKGQACVTVVEGKTRDNTLFTQPA